MGAGKIRSNLNVVASGAARTGVMMCGDVWVPIEERYEQLEGTEGPIIALNGKPVIKVDGQQIVLDHLALMVCLKRGHRYHGTIIRDAEKTLGCHCELRE